ncbi:MAG: plastocyanin/azurin family copper-binding protein [Nitrososphaerales archaeon]
MTIEEESPIRTTRNRFGKGIAIILIIMAIGAGINLALGDFWHKFPPASQQPQPRGPTGGVTPTGNTVEVTLTFVESADLRTLGFNKPAGEEGANPDIVVHVGDKVIIKAVNGGRMPHAFGVVTDPDNPNSIIFNSRIKSADNPMLRGEEGDVEFMPDKEGEYYYICTVPGHAAQGMQGKFIVKKAEVAPTAAQSAQPTGLSHVFDLHFVESADLRTLGFNAPAGDSDANPEFRVKAGDKVTFNVINDGKMPHAFGVVTDPDNPNSIIFNSRIKSADNSLLRGQTGQVTFIADKVGTYYYICTVPGHAAQGMQGKFIVE